MVKVVYPDGNMVNFMWIKNGYGFVRMGNKIFKYSLPKQKEDELEPVGEDM